MELKENILQQLIDIGIALSSERRIPRLHEKILKSAKEITHADGGTIYSVIDKKFLRFEIMFSDTLDLRLHRQYDDLPLFLENGEPNERLMVAYAVNHKKTINVKDAYYEEGFDFSGTRRFDERSGYRTKAVLTIPMKNHENEVIAVLQLINPKEGVFTSEDVRVAEALASQAGIALNNRLLIQNLRSLFDSLIRVIADAIDEKSPSTGNHGKRVPVVAQLLGKAVGMSEEEIYELKIAAFLHDCGKITTPDHIVEKHTKLETVYDRIEAIDARFTVYKLQVERELLLKKLRWFEIHYPQDYNAASNDFSSYENETWEQIEELEDDQIFVHHCNEGKEEINEKAKERLNQLAAWDLLTSDELENLSIPHGNLTKKERQIIEHHVVMTYRMLSQLPFPKELAKVPEIAGSHHERMDGKGYPRGLKGDEMSVQARILMIADVFESLSAPDRSYRKPAPLSEVFRIMQKMVQEGHLDPGLYEIFLKEKVYLPYAERYLMPEQLDV